MAKTKKGSKSPGYEFWGKRPGTKKGPRVGPKAKNITHRAERQEGKKVIKYEKENN